MLTLAGPVFFMTLLLIVRNERKGEREKREKGMMDRGPSS